LIDALSSANYTFIGFSKILNIGFDNPGGSLGNCKARCGMFGFNP
jgi:hypothetical protein